MERVTDFRIGILELSSKEYLQLPSRVTQFIRTYGEKLSEKNGIVRVELAAYRWPELLAAMKGQPK